MSDKTKIEWTDATWNPVTGCTKVSPGCDHCYADTFAERWRGTPGHYFENGFDVQLRPDKLDQPLRWKNPRLVFVNSMSDLFHKDVPDRFIGEVFGVMGAAKQHTFQLLTKRHARLRSLLQRWSDHLTVGCHCPSDEGGCSAPVDVLHGVWPLPNVHVGVSVENQQWADIRIPALLDTPAAVRWISAEPLLGPIDLDQPRCDAHDRREVVTDSDGREWCGYCSADGFTGELSFGHWLDPLNGGIGWVVAGGESGRGARPMHPDWARSLRDQCVASGVPYLFKQWGVWCPPHPDQGQSIFGHVTNEDACQVVTMDGALRGRPWPGWGIQDGTRDAVVMRRYGKKAAGRLLDGRTWDEFPETVTAAGVSG